MAKVENEEDAEESLQDAEETNLGSKVIVSTVSYVELNSVEEDAEHCNHAEIEQEQDNNEEPEEQGSDEIEEGNSIEQKFDNTEIEQGQGSTEDDEEPEEVFCIGSRSIGSWNVEDIRLATW
ncbi:hypothetical protein CCACVL1_10752, partial [Corchorus capsularis]